MKILHRWPRSLLFLIYVTMIVLLILVMRRDYVDIQSSSASNNYSGGVALNLSFVTAEPQKILSSMRSQQLGDDWSTSFLVQSQNPIVEVYLDSVSIYGNAELDRYCFASFHLNKDRDIPADVVYAIENLLARTSDAQAPMGRLVKIGDPAIATDYMFKLNEPLCLDNGHGQGRNHNVPHLFLGAISSETYANLQFIGLPTIQGYQALEFFPFDKQKLVFNLAAQYKDNYGGQYIIHPNVNVSLSQPGWIGKIESVDGRKTLTFSRPLFYKIILITFTLAMLVIILFLNNIIDEVGSFFEVTFGLLLGLWGMHEILIPDYVDNSIPVDAAIYILYAFVILEIFAILIDEFIHMMAKRSIKITNIESPDLDGEFVEITNTGTIPIDMTRWVLLDQASHRFKFPFFILPGNIPFRKKKNRTVRIWTKACPQNLKNKQLKEHLKENLYWGRKKRVWDNNRDIAYLEDGKGDAISTYYYPVPPAQDEVKNRKPVPNDFVI